jgi:hypothetical protein
MGYSMRNGQWADTEELKLNPLEGTLTTDGYSAIVEVGDRAVARLRLLTTAVSSSDVVDVTIQTSRDGITFFTSGTFTQVATTIDATWDQRKTFLLDRFVRAHFNVTGAAVSIALTLTGEAA